MTSSGYLSEIVDFSSHAFSVLLRTINGLRRSRVGHNTEGIEKFKLNPTI